MTSTIRLPDLVAWLATAMPGERIVYHRGMLADDCAEVYPLHDLNHVRSMVYNAYVSGHVHLIQHRHGEGDYSYVAVATKPRPPRAYRTTGPLTEVGDT